MLSWPCFLGEAQTWMRVCVPEKSSERGTGQNEGVPGRRQEGSERPAGSRPMPQPPSGDSRKQRQRLGCRTVEGADLPALHAGELLPVSVHPLQHLGPLRGDLVTGALHSTDLATQNHHPPGCPSSGASAEGSDDRPLQKEPGRVWGHLGGDLGRTL